MNISFSHSVQERPEPVISKGASLAEQTYIYIKERIVHLEIEPGEQLLENTIARELGISRSPVREAFANLESKGFIQIVPWQGAQVTPITEQYITELYQVRAALEASAARLATPYIEVEELEGMRADMEALAVKLQEEPRLFYEAHEVPFHELFVARCPNVLLQNMLAGIQDHIRRIRNYLSHTHVPGHVQHSYAEHWAILEALTSGDPGEAERAVQFHLLNVLERIVANLPPELNGDE